MPWKWRKKNPLPRFILDIPYALYFSVVPSREALNEVLVKGSAGGGMGTGLIWDPFEIEPDEYKAILCEWEKTDLHKILKIKKRDMADLNFIFDEEIMAILHHPAYLMRSRQKYQSKFWNNRRISSSEKAD